jgi:hypothetical protein
MLINRIPPLLSNCLALFAIYYLLLPAPAYGYFDLGTGTYMLQMALGFGAAIWLSLRTSWIRFDRKKKASADTNETPVADKTPTAEAGQSEAAQGES